MRLDRRIGGAIFALVLCLAPGAWASDATLVADRAGFLLGHAHRCGVDVARLERSGARLVELIGAFAADADDREAAEARFNARVLASALAKQLGDPLADCATVRAQLARLEQHLRPVPDGASQGERLMSDDQSSASGTGRPARATAAKPGNPAEPDRSAKRASTRTEELAPEQRAELARKIAARQQRRRPPSI
jgi:hypothetical protein